MFSFRTAKLTQILVTTKDFNFYNTNYIKRTVPLMYNYGIDSMFSWYSAIFPPYFL